MNYCLLSRGDELSNRLAERFRELAAERGLTEDGDAPDIVVSIGGDGTLLKAFHTFLHRVEQVSFVGVHTGHLGFFADWKADEIEQLVQNMAEHAANRHGHIVRYPLVEVVLTGKGGQSVHYALNEFTVKGSETMLVAQLNINNEPFEMFRGDGICVSTPSGSTAYNKSLGGAVIHPTLESIQIAEIASINNRVYRTLGSSMVLPRHHHCDIMPRSGQRLLLSFDHLQQETDDVESITCRVADKKVSFIRYRPFPFWTRVREAFILNGEI